jgi:hypothetical protein
VCQRNTKIGNGLGRRKEAHGLLDVRKLAEEESIEFEFLGIRQNTRFLFISMYYGLMLTVRIRQNAPLSRYKGGVKSGVVSASL